MWFQDVSDPEEAGWFQEEHTHPDKFGSQWEMTPDHKLLKPEGPKDIILLSTGGFAPIHNGHVAMMEAAKTHLESKGFRVRGGYSLDEFSQEEKNNLPEGIKQLCQKDFPIDVPASMLLQFFDRFDVMLTHSDPKPQTKKERKEKRPIEYTLNILFLCGKGKHFRC